MRLYRGLREPYRPRHAPGARGADFTDCPYTALQYASARRGVVLVLDVPDGASTVTVREELWLGARAKRLMVWGSFDDLLAGVLPAKELRARIRQRGIGNLPDSDKGMILKHFIRESLAATNTKRFDLHPPLR